MRDLEHEPLRTNLLECGSILFKQGALDPIFEGSDHLYWGNAVWIISVVPPRSTMRIFVVAAPLMSVPTALPKSTQNAPPPRHQFQEIPHRERYRAAA